MHDTAHAQTDQRFFDRGTSRGKFDCRYRDLLATVVSAAIDDVRGFTAAWARGDSLDSLAGRRADARAGLSWLLSREQAPGNRLSLADCCGHLDIDTDRVRAAVLDSLPAGAADAILNGERSRCTSLPATPASASVSTATNLAKSGASAALV